MAPLVSILVPCYNAGPYLRGCLESAISQTHRDCEIIFVDDGSTDDSLAVANALASSRMRIIRQDNGGQAAALNTAIREAEGTYYQFLDADDVLDRDKIARQVARLESAGPMVIASGAWTSFRTATAEGAFLPDRVWRDTSPIEWLIDSWSGGGMMPPIAWLIPRRVADAAGPWEESLRWAANLDADFFSRALLAASSVAFCPDALSYYRSHSSSTRMSRDRSRKSMEATLRVLIRTGEALLQRSDSAKARQAFADNLQRYAYSVYPSHPDLVASAEDRMRRLGTSSIQPDGNRVFLALRKPLGWKLARRAELLSRHLVRDR